MSCDDQIDVVNIVDADNVPWVKSVSREGNKIIRTFYAPDTNFVNLLAERDNATFTDFVPFPVYSENGSLEQGVVKFFSSLLFEYESPSSMFASVSRVNFVGNGLFVSSPFPCTVILERSVNFGSWVTAGRSIVSGENYVMFNDFFSIGLFVNQNVNVRWRVGFLTSSPVGVVFGDDVSSFVVYYENRNSESTLVF